MTVLTLWEHSTGPGEVFSKTYSCVKKKRLKLFDLGVDISSIIINYYIKRKSQQGYLEVCVCFVCTPVVVCVRKPCLVQWK